MKHKVMYMNQFVKVTLFCIIGIIFFLLIQNLLKPKWNYPILQENETASLQTFFLQEKNNNDVIFLGASHMEYAVSPMELYKDKGIISYNLATAGQPLDSSYFLLREAFQTQSPRVVVLDVSMIFAEGDWIKDNGRRYVLDALPMGINKIKAACHYAELCNCEENLQCSNLEHMQERFNSVIFPITNYHSRWKELNVTDYRDYFAKDNYLTAGYFLTPTMLRNIYSVDDMNYLADYHKKDSWKIEVQDGIKSTEYLTSLLNEPKITEEGLYWIKAINELCIENDAELLLTKIPSVYNPLFYPGAWTQAKSNVIKEIAHEEEIEYIDLLYDVNIELNGEIDYSDGGCHLNYLGARKVSSFFSKYLKSNYDIGEMEYVLFDENMELYDSVTELALLQMETDFYTYIQKVVEKQNDYIVCLAMYGPVTSALSDQDIECLELLGLKTNFNEYKYYDTNNAFLAIIDGTEVLYEAISSRNFEYETDIDNINIKIASNGGDGESSAYINIRNIDKTFSGNGLNIVLIDKGTGYVIDSTLFSIQNETNDCIGHRDALLHMNNYWFAKEK